jgi:hypothetical protein
MSNDIFHFDDIAGQPATLEINERGNHMTVTWGALTVAETSGHIGFWESFNSTAGAICKGAARDAALHKHARETIEREIYSHIKFLQAKVKDEE